ncbi:PilZ domain-containing protein [Desulfovibrio sp. OttesenSCG-928-G15]|nr:PilZ domain-containing protein [Desulfovibrio sp. OttesenSCG-928-G15]
MVDFGSQENSNRRAYQRVPLDAPFFATIHRQGEALNVLIVDCSRGGMQFALPPGVPMPEEWLGSPVFISGLPAVFDADGNGCPAILNWLGSSRCGVRFEQPLAFTDEALRSVLDSF